MGILHTDEVKAGQILGEDILTPQGMKIASKGNAVSERHLKAFKAWGVAKVLIQGEIQPDNSVEKEKLNCDLDCQENLEVINHIFSKTNRDDPVIHELYEAVVRRSMVQ